MLHGGTTDTTQFKRAIDMTGLRLGNGFTRATRAASLLKKIAASSNG